MVVLARTLDIPARVVTGYSPGEPLEGGWLARAQRPCLGRLWLRRAQAG